MKNDTRSNVHHRHTALCLAMSATLFAAPVSAEVGLPPPAQHQGAGFPSEQALRQKGYDPKTGVWRVQSQNNGRPTVTKSGDTIKGSQQKTVTVTGNYGEKATIRTTQTQTVNSSKLQTAANTVAVGVGFSNGANQAGDYVNQMGNAVAKGNYGQAAYNAWQGVANFVDGFFGSPAKSSVGLLGQFGEGYLDGKVESTLGLKKAAQQAATAQAQAEQGGNLGGAIAAAAAKKAAEGAAAAKQAEQKAQGAREQAKQGKTIWQLTKFIDFKNGPIVKQSLGEYTDKLPRYKRSRAEYDGTGEHDGVVFEEGSFSGYLPKKAPKGVIIITIDYKSVSYDQIGRQNPETVLRDMMLNQQDIKDILSRMLNNQQTNHAELMNQLSRIGDAVEKSTESNQFTPMTADSAPYTPQGSNTPQQTRFTLNADGSVSTSIIPRPDLKPNSTLAPTRSEIIPTPNRGQNTPTTPNSPNTPTTPDSPNAPTPPNGPNTPNQPNNPTGQQNQNQENQQQNFCQQNPNAAQCMQGGDMTYEDIVLPENTIDLSFSPENVFQTEGVCPQPKSVDLGAFGQVEFSYQPLCDFAAKLRPVLIMMTILTCAWFVYGALEEL